MEVLDKLIECPERNEVLFHSWWRKTGSQTKKHNWREGVLLQLWRSAIPCRERMAFFRMITGEKAISLSASLNPWLTTWPTVRDDGTRQLEGASRAFLFIIPDLLYATNIHWTHVDSIAQDSIETNTQYKCIPLQPYEIDGKAIPEFLYVPKVSDVLTGRCLTSIPNEPQLNVLMTGKTKSLSKLQSNQGFRNFLTWILFQHNSQRYAVHVLACLKIAQLNYSLRE